MSEREVVPLNGDEVLEAILFRVKESLKTTCHLKYDNAYSSFTGEIRIQLTLSDFGRQVQDNHVVTVAGETGLPGEPREFDVTEEIEPAPPNEVRVDSDQPVPVMVQDGPKKVEKRLRYAARKKP